MAPRMERAALSAKLRRLPISLGDAFERAMNEYEYELTLSNSVLYRSAFRWVEREFHVGGRGTLQSSRDFGEDTFAVLCWQEDDYCENLYSEVIERYFIRCQRAGTMEERIYAVELRRAWRCAPWIDHKGEVISEVIS